MKSNRIFKRAFSELTDTERELFFLLTGEKTTRENVIDFLHKYKIDEEPSVSTFFINDLLNRFQLQEEESPFIPRIRGVATFFRFQNATALMHQPGGELITDPDLILKIRFQDEIRPFPASQAVLDQNVLKHLAGTGYRNRISKETVSVRLKNREYLIPKDSFLPDILYLGLLWAIRYGQNKNNVLCYLYDIYRYCEGKKPSKWVRFSALKMELRHKAGRIKRWRLR